MSYLAAIARFLPILIFLAAQLAPKLREEFGEHLTEHGRKNSSKCRFCRAERILPESRIGRKSKGRSTKKARRSKGKSAKRKGHHERRGNPAGLIKAIEANPRMSASTKAKAIKKLKAND